MNAPDSMGRSVSAMVAVMLSLSICVLGLILLFKTAPDNTSRVHVNEQGGTVVDYWRPVPGCLYLQSANGPVLWPLDGRNAYNAAMGPLCGAGSRVLPEAQVPKSLLPWLLAANNAWRTPMRAGPGALTGTVVRDGIAIPQGARIGLSLDSALSATTQQLAECMTGQHPVCLAIGIDPDSWDKNIDGAAMRAVGVVVVNIQSGKIEALASAHSACYAAEHSGAPLPAGCPTPGVERDHPLPGRLDHHAFMGYKPGSLVKIIMVIGLMRDPVLGPALRQMGSAARNAMLSDIMVSDSPSFLDRAFCRDLGFTRCTRLQRIAEAAVDLGWNERPANLLEVNGMPAPPETVAPVTPRFLSTLTAHGLVPMPLEFDAEQANQCAFKPEDRWFACKQRSIGPLSTELLGQGNAMASPVSIAHMLVRLGNAANGSVTAPRLHLIDSVQGQVDGKAVALASDAPTLPLNISQAEAQMALDGMALTHKILPGKDGKIHPGTTASACIKAYGGGAPALALCARLMGVSGKTGTPSFKLESKTWQERTEYCRTRKQDLDRPGLSKARRFQIGQEYALCKQLPMKWYAALVRDDPSSEHGPYTRAICVLAERTYQKSGTVDSLNDKGPPNVAAELGFRLIRMFDQKARP